MVKKYNHIILFDGECNLCDSLVQFILRFDKKEKFGFSSLQSEFSQSKLNEYKIPNDLSTVVYLRKNEIFFKSDAALLMLFDLGGVWKLFIVFKLIPKFLRDWIYGKVSFYRYKVFGKKELCLMPEPRFKERFFT